MRVRRIHLLFGMAVLSVAAMGQSGCFRFGCQQAAPIPPRQAIVDQAGVLGPQELQNLTNQIQSISSQLKRHINILVVGSTAPYSVQNYTLMVGSQWGLAQDDRVLIVLVIEQKEITISTSRNLAGSFTPQIKAHIIDDIVAPEFRSGRYYAGLNKTCNYLQRKFENESGRISYP